MKRDIRKFNNNKLEAWKMTLVLKLTINKRKQISRMRSANWQIITNGKSCHDYRTVSKLLSEEMKYRKYVTFTCPSLPKGYDYNDGVSA